MFAVIKTGGKQYKVAADDVLTVEKLEGGVGESVTFDDVLMIVDGEAVTVGAPRVDGASVRAELVDQTKGPKLISFKKRRRKHGSARRKGHRQQLTQVRIVEIVAGANTGA
jgi:large subunit ribosomal protein L21